MIDKTLLLVTVAALVAVSLAQAQPAGPIPTIGIIGHTQAAPFEEGLRELGWVEGTNVRFERRVTTDVRRLGQFAAELVRMRVDVIFAGNAPATRAVVAATPRARSVQGLRMAEDVDGQSLRPATRNGPIREETRCPIPLCRPQLAKHSRCSRLRCY